MPRRRYYKSRNNDEPSIAQLILMAIFACVFLAPSIISGIVLWVRNTYDYLTAPFRELISSLTPVQWWVFVGVLGTLAFLGVIIAGVFTYQLYIIQRTRRQQEIKRQRHLVEIENYRQLEHQKQKDKERAIQFHRISQMSIIKSLDALDLEKYTAELFERLGYKVKLTSTFGDHGIDVHLLNPLGEHEAAQCKQWPHRNKNLVGEPEIRDFYGAMMAENIVRGYMVAPHGFTQEAMRWATGKPIVLADANWLYVKASEIELHLEETASNIQQNSPKQVEPPLCPRCGKPMNKILAKQGTYAGKYFYGCPNYPSCKEKVNIIEQ